MIMDSIVILLFNDKNDLEWSKMYNSTLLLFHRWPTFRANIYLFSNPYAATYFCGQTQLQLSFVKVSLENKAFQKKNLILQETLISFVLNLTGQFIASRWLPNSITNRRLILNAFFILLKHIWRHGLVIFLVSWHFGKE